MNKNLAILSLVMVAGCSSGTSGPGSTEGANTGGGGGGGGNSSGTANSSGTGTTGSAGSSSGSPSMTLTIPFQVSTDYVPSGYMGDGMVAGSIMQLPQTMSDSQTCDGDRSPPAAGICYAVTYTPVSTTAGGLGWGGVYWQYPSNNWGMQPGISIGPGATKVAVWAKGMSGGEALQFTVGGINNMHSGGTYADAFQADVKVTLTTSWAEYDVPLPAEYSSSTSGVIGALSWTAGAPTSGNAISFKLDSITWE
jgi:hypothetical protein